MKVGFCEDVGLSRMTELVTRKEVWNSEFDVRTPSNIDCCQKQQMEVFNLILQLVESVGRFSSNYHGPEHSSKTGRLQGGLFAEHGVSYIPAVVLILNHLPPFGYYTSFHNAL